MMKVFFDKVKRAAALALTVAVVAAGSAAAAPRSPVMPPKSHGQMVVGHPNQLPRHKPAPRVAPRPVPAPRHHDGGSGDTVKALAVGAVMGAAVGSLAANSK